MDRKVPAPHPLHLASPLRRLTNNCPPLIVQRSASDLIQRARLAPNMLTPADIQVLQRTLGNRAVQRMVGERGVERKTPLPVAQTKLRVGSPSDSYEQEANHLSRQAGPQLSGAVPAVQRKIGTAGKPVDSTVENQLRATQNSGQPLPDRTRRTLEPRLGADLTKVKIHTDSKAIQLNRQLGAKAFTNKNHIYYGAGQRPSDLQLTAHEAVHTVQQGAVLQTKPTDDASGQSTQQLPANSGVIQRIEVMDSRNGKIYETDEMDEQEIIGLALTFFQLHNMEELKKLQIRYDFVPSDPELSEIAWGGESSQSPSSKIESKTLPMYSSTKESTPFVKQKLEKTRKHAKGLAKHDFLPAEIVANTHAFLSINLSRLTLWETDDVEEMKIAIGEGYLKKNKLIGKNDKAEDLSLPNALGLIKDPGGSVGRDMQTKKKVVKKWKRDKELFSDESRNREESSKTPRRDDWTPTKSEVGHFPSSLVSIEDVKDVPRLTRDKSEKFKKGSSKWAPKEVYQGEFDYDDYDYDEMKESGFGVVTDELGVNFGAGPSGTIGDTVLAGRYLTKKNLKKKVKEKYKSEKLDKGFLPSITKKKERKKAKTKIKLENMREIATAAIAYLTNEGHHSLIECVLPLEKPLNLTLGNDPPEEIFIRQIMPDRLVIQLKQNLDTWINEQFSQQPVLGALVKSRIEQYLD